jgi:sortase A
LLKKAAVLVPVIAVAAAAPWLVPGRNDAAAPSANPSSIIEQVREQRPAAGANGQPRPRVPTDADVKELTDEVARTAVAGYDMPISAKDLASVRTVPGPYRKLGRIQIPAIGLDVAYGEGVFAKTLSRGPGHWPGTPMPGRTGNAVLSGHRNTYTAPFKELDELRNGDEIIVTYGDEEPVTFKVRKTTIVTEAEYKDFVLRQPRDDKAREITLFACHPEGNPVFRIVVQAAVESAGS